MNKIKSDRAKAYIRQHTFDCENCDTIERHMWSSDARQAVRYAEQDADARAKKAFCKATCNDGICCDECNCNDMRAFVELLNKGGQSDGD